MFDESNLELNDDLFGEENADDDDRHLFSDDDDQAAAGQGASTSKKFNEPAAATVKRKVLKNPRPKLNPERLCGNRGLMQLPKIFANFTIKGKGHEKDDLDVMMKLLEHWIYRLFPQLPFNEALEKIEQLGAKRQVQTYLKKIRLGMVVADDDVINMAEEDITNKTDDVVINEGVEEMVGMETNDINMDNIDSELVTLESH